MDVASVLLAVAGTLAAQLPMWIVWIVALALAIARWKLHPKVSMLVVIAVGVLALETIVSAFVHSSIPLYMSSSGRSISDIAVLLSVYGFFTSLVAAGCWGMLIAAVFGWRGRE